MTNERTGNGKDEMQGFFAALRMTSEDIAPSEEQIRRF
jgi:hypothetical protein